MVMLREEALRDEVDDDVVLIPGGTTKPWKERVVVLRGGTADTTPESGAPLFGEAEGRVPLLKAAEPTGLEGTGPPELGLIVVANWSGREDGKLVFGKMLTTEDWKIGTTTDVADVGKGEMRLLLLTKVEVRPRTVDGNVFTNVGLTIEKLAQVEVIGPPKAMLLDGTETTAAEPIIVCSRELCPIKLATGAVVARVGFRLVSVGCTAAVLGFGGSEVAEEDGETAAGDDGTALTAVRRARDARTLAVCVPRMTLISSPPEFIVLTNTETPLTVNLPPSVTPGTLILPPSVIPLKEAPFAGSADFIGVATGKSTGAGGRFGVKILPLLGGPTKMPALQLLWIFMHFLSQMAQFVDPVGRAVL